MTIPRLPQAVAALQAASALAGADASPTWGRPGGLLVTGERAATTCIALLLAFALGVVGLNLAGPDEPPELQDAQTPMVNPLAQLFHMGDVEPATPGAWPDAARAPSELPLPPGYVRVCGLGPVPAAQDEPGGLAGITADARVITHARLRKLFAAHPSEQVRAAGLVLDLAVARGDAAAAARARLGRCEPADKACEARRQSAAAAAADAAGVTPIRSLSRMAMVTADPFVYAAALQACTQGNPGDTADHCGMLNLYRWVQLDSGNAAPWMALGSAAQANGDIGALNDAMYHVATSRRVDSYWGTLPHVLMQALPPGESDLARTLLTVDAWNAQNVLALPVYKVVAQHCDADQLHDANRRQVCDGIAHVLTERGRSTVDLDMGIALAQKVGWPASRTDALQVEREALVSVAPQLADAGGVSCASVQRFRETAELMTQYGELGSYRVLALQSGMTVDELVQVLRPQPLAAEAAGSMPAP